MKGLNKLGKVITKILEVFHWVGTALMLAATICKIKTPRKTQSAFRGAKNTIILNSTF